ncbi:MAG: preprotein translocase subunit SecG [Parachlamydia sp.]|jgi:preprotein translocase subunit SecG|nr:MAG: preprotein translocase subunit SecG [Parachlamydia sp.]
MMALYFISIALFLLLCIVLCFVILIQESKSSGLGASFGGDTSDSLFGTSTPDVLKKLTGWMAFIFLGACVLLSLWTAAMGRSQVPDYNPYTIEQRD